MDPSMKIGKIKEQVQTEHAARRNFNRRWGKLDDAELNKFYNQNKINRQLRSELKMQDLCPAVYTGQGESYFVSPNMYEVLVGECRCGRKRTEAHLLKCLQREKSRYSESAAAMEKDTEIEAENVQIASEGPAASKPSNLPATANAYIGWQTRKPAYQQWERSMQYVSPVHTMPGHRIAATPYNAIIIG